ncbi:hypothetical protein ABGV49_04305 [Chromobacterium vaccinii]|uniref:BACON domain-containing protein n=1 Tax=Chromobacterium vaccinii TaxID=1108595 RepID=A0ABV0F890_9NEIS
MKVWQSLSMLLMVSMLSACGGGGGGGGGSGDAAGHVQEALPPSAVQLSPALLGGNQSAGSSQTWTVQASVSDPSRFNSTIYLYVVDSQQVLAGTPQLTWLGGNQMALTLHTSGTLAAGHYKGTLQFQLCKDPQCGSSFLSGPLTLPYDFSVAAQPLQAILSGVASATAVIGQRSNFSSWVLVNGFRGKWTAKTSSNWLLLSNASGQGAGSFNVSMSTERLAAGAYTDNVTVTSDDGQTVTLPFSVNVRPVQFVASQDSFSFSGINGSELPGQILQLSLNNNGEGAWTASSNAAWLQAGAVSGITPSSIPLSADPSRGALASGNYNGTLHLSAAGVENKDIAASLSLTKASFTLPAQGIVLGGDKGRDLATPQNLQFALNTGNKSWPWKVASQPTWLKTGAANGSLNQTAQALSLNGDFSQATVGSTTAALKLSAQINGDAVEGTVPVTINRDQRRLLPSKWGVAFSSTPTGKVLSKTLTIKDNFGGTLNWTATSDAPWLKVTASGQTGNGSTLQLQVDDSQLTTGGVSYAKILITTDSPSVESAVIRVAGWKSDKSSSGVLKIPGDFTEIVADPIRPYVYAARGQSEIHVFNIYTAQEVGKIDNVAGNVGKMTVSPDGGRLYAVDTYNQELSIVDLDLLRRVDSWALSGMNYRMPILAIRPNGVEFVFAGNGVAYRNGKSFGTSIYGDILTATDDGHQVYTLDTGVSGSTRAGYEVDYSQVAAGAIFVSRHGNQWWDGISSFGVALSVSGDGSYLYEVANQVNQCQRIDSVSLNLINLLTRGIPAISANLSGVVALGDGRVVCVANIYSNEKKGGAVFWVYGAGGSLLKQVVFGSDVIGLVNVISSGDSLMLIAVESSWFATTGQVGLVILPVDNAGG